MAYGSDGRFATLGELINPYTSYRLSSDEIDQHESFTGEWAFPAIGTRFYFEWGRNDFSSGYRAIMLWPQRAHAFAIGEQKRFELPGDHWLSLRGEIAQLLISRDYDRVSPTDSGFYSHGIVWQGHTQRGQVLGAPAGPGADVQHVGLRWHGPSRMLEFSVERVATRTRSLPSPTG